MPRATLKSYKPEAIQWIRENFKEAKEDPQRAAAILKTFGYYSGKTYLPDIAGAVRKIVALIEAGK